MMGEPVLAVVDASIAVKWFVTEGESGVSEADELLAEHAAGKVRLVAPALLVHELFNVLVRRDREVEDLSEAMNAFFDADVVVISPDREQVALAVEMVANGGVSTFDAAYLALARVLGCRLVTADARLAKRAEVLLG